MQNSRLTKSHNCDRVGIVKSLSKEVKNLPKLSGTERQAVDIMKDHIKKWVEDGLREGNREGELTSTKRITFEEFEEISQDRQKPLLIQALKEVVSEIEA